MGTRLRETWSGDGSVQREYPAHYQPADSLAGHLEFALKHEGVNLAVLGDLFHASGPGLVEKAVAAKPTGRYRRQMGFFYRPARSLPAKCVRPQAAIRDGSTRGAALSGGRAK